MALERGGRLKECVVTLSKVWTYAAELSLEERRTKSFLAVSGQCYRGGPLGLSSWTLPSVSCDRLLPLWREAKCLPLGVSGE